MLAEQGRGTLMMAMAGHCAEVRGARYYPGKRTWASQLAMIA